MSLSSQKLVAELDHSLGEMALGDVKRASKPGSRANVKAAKMGGFILGLCFIDAMAGFHDGQTVRNDKRGEKRFKNFVRKYLSQYNADDLYKDARCGLVHSYAIEEKYSFTDRGRGGKHMSRIKARGNQRTLLNLEHFIADIECAYQALRADILSDQAAFRKAKKRYEALGLLNG